MPFLTELSEDMMIWADAVQSAGSLDRNVLIEVMESGKEYEFPSGKVSIDRKTLHAMRDVYVADLHDKQFVIKEKFSQVPPLDTQTVCDLEKVPNANKHYEIRIEDAADHLRPRLLRRAESCMDYALIVLIELLCAVAGLVLIAAGLALIAAALAIIFGIMRVINIAHGEFLMLGGYTVVLTTKLGVNLWVAILVLAPLVVGVFGVIVERCIIQFLYNRLLDSILATWGLNLLIIRLVTVVFGNTVEGVVTPLGGFAIGDYKMANYTLVLIFTAALIMVCRAQMYSLRADGAIDHAEPEHGGGTWR